MISDNRFAYGIYYFTTLPRILMLFVLPLYHFTTLPLLYAQVDLYPFPHLEEGKIKKEREKKPVDPFVQALSKKMGIAEKLLTEMMSKGFGRTEIIRLILIFQKSGKTIEELIQQREKGMRMAKIAEGAGISPSASSPRLRSGQAGLSRAGAGQDYRVIRKDSEKILKELEKEAEKIKSELARGTTAVAGISDTLTKSGTGYFETAPADDEAGLRGKNGKQSKP